MGPYLCIIKKVTDMSKEIRNWIENSSEIEDLINDLELEFIGDEF